GAYSVNSSTFLILMMAGFALLGYVFGKLGCEGAPFLLRFVLGPLMEENFRRSMVLSFGDPTIFLRRPISLCILLAGLALIALIIIPQFRIRRDEAFQDKSMTRKGVQRFSEKIMLKQAAPTRRAGGRRNSGT